MPLIKDIFARRDPEEHWRSRGWGPEWRFPAAGPGGQPISLRVRTPLDWTKVDVRKLPERAPTGSVAEAMRRLSATIGTAGVIALLGVEHTVAREGTPDLHLFATLTVALKDLDGPMPESLPEASVAPIELNTVGGRYAGVRVRRVSKAEIVAGQPPMAFLTVQYMVRTRYGVLASTFATPQQEIFDRLIPVFDKIAGAIWLEAGE